jgi:hypothetical protein
MPTDQTNWRGWVSTRPVIPESPPYHDFIQYPEFSHRFLLPSYALRGFLPPFRRFLDCEGIAAAIGKARFSGSM